MTKHYEFTEEVKNDTFYRIRSLIDIPEHEVKAGDIGGWMTKDSELGENCWVFDDAMVESSTLEGSVLVYDVASVRKSKVKGNSSIKGSSDIFMSDVTNVLMRENGTIQSSTIETDNEYHHTTILGKASMTSCNVFLENKAIPYGLSLTGDSRMRGSTIRGADIEIDGGTDVFNSKINGVHIEIDATEEVRVCKIQGNDIVIKDCGKLRHCAIKGNQITLKNNNETFALKMNGDSNELCFIAKGNDIQINGSNVLISYAEVESSIFTSSQTIKGDSMKDVLVIKDASFELPNTLIKGANRLINCHFSEGYNQKLDGNKNTFILEGTNILEGVELNTIKPVKILGDNSLKDILIEGEILIEGKNQLKDMYVVGKGNQIIGSCSVETTSMEGNNNQILDYAKVLNEVKNVGRIELGGDVTIKEFAGILSNKRIQVREMTLVGDKMFVTHNKKP